MNNTNKSRKTKSQDIRNNIKTNEDEQKEEEKNNKKWLFLLLLLLFLCVFGYLIFRVGYDFGQSKQPASPAPLPTKFVIKISDDNGDWTEGENLNIFVVAGREYVAPYDKGLYDFQVLNTINKKVSYKLVLEEDNKDKVNIKYRLKENGKYIIGVDDWVYYDQIVLENIILNSKEADSYQLEWMWVSENNELDTAIGEKEDRAVYSITFKVVAAELEG